MSTEGIEAVFLETHNWGKAAKFFQALGYELEFATDHNSGQLRNGDGPYVFIAEVPEDREPDTQIVFKVPTRHLPARRRRRGGQPVRGDPLRDQGDDRPRPRRAHCGASRRRGATGSSASPSAGQHGGADRAVAGDARPGRRAAARPRGRDRACGWPTRTTAGASAPTWTPRPPAGTGPRIVARARFVEDLVVEQAGRGRRPSTSILGAGLDTFAQRRPEIAARLRVFEIDQPGPQAWKRQRLAELGLGVPDWLHLVPVDFEAGPSWLELLADAGFDRRTARRRRLDRGQHVPHEGGQRGHPAPDRRARSGVDARHDVPAAGRAARRTATAPVIAARRARRRRPARRSSAPSPPTEMLALARSAGFRTATHVSGDELNSRYFADRADGLRIAKGEEFLVATT